MTFGLAFPQTSTAADFVSKTGSFEFYRQADPITDDNRSLIAADALEDNGFLAWKCQEGLLQVYISQPGQYYSADGSFTVALRFDKNKAVDLEDWSASTDKKALFMDLGEVKEFTTSALKSSQIVLRTKDSSDETILSTFKLNGLETSLKKLDCSDF